jgi:hypothetical protein
MVNEFVSEINHTKTGITTLMTVIRVITKSGVLAPESSGAQIELRHLNTVFELYSSYHLGQVVEAA